MNKFLVFIFLISFFPQSTLAAQSWYYPVSDFSGRQSLKSFGQYFERKDYVGKEDIFPNQFLGYHAGIDLEASPSELNQPVPVYAVSSGQIIYSGFMSGYGGLILQKLEGDNLVALYGHLQQSGLPKLGSQVAAGSHLAFLGSAFSADTAGERKHLHFGIYRGVGSYYKGYETSVSALNLRWLNPSDYLLSQKALDPVRDYSPTPVPTLAPATSVKNSNPLIRLLVRILDFFGLKLSY